MSRHKAREIGFKYVYQIAFGQPLIIENDGFWDMAEEENKALTKDEKKFIESIVNGVKENLEEIDKEIFSKITGRAMDRVFKIDLAILRVAVYELLYNKDLSYKVVVNEAVEIAKRYGEDNSHSFINGILREVIKEKVEIKNWIKYTVFRM